MQIRIETLKNRPCKLKVEKPLEAFPVLHELAGQGELAVHGTIRAELVAMQVNDLVEVEGSLSCTVVLSCSRCLQPVAQQFEIPVALTFTRVPAGTTEEGDELELSEDTIGLIPFEGETIDLRVSLEQELLMALPQHPLCAADCAGLCPVCGADLNRQRCACIPPVFHGGLAALKGFKVAKE
jgi:uncharacterized protein